ncbi:MAG: ABC transporter ATP-binding protein [Deltaproteobacteria bacterium]|nr:ABC transporter ATP-binding protein [Deltaproteobacteria bacterium]
MLTISNLEVVYHRVVLVLRGVSLEVPDGQCVALLGPNGAGKTTLLRAVTGLLPIHDGAVTKGSVRWQGQEIAGWSSERIVGSGIAQVMEGRRVFADLSVEDNLLSGAYGRKRRAEVRQDLEALYERFPVLRERRRQQAGYLSGGEQQMVAIGRARISRPRLLLLDEPSLGLAPKIVADVARLVREIVAEGVSVLLVEQNAALALELAGQGYILENGRVVHEGSSERLRADKDVQEFYLGLGEEAGSYRDVKLYRRRRRWLS